MWCKMPSEEAEKNLIDYNEGVLTNIMLFIIYNNKVKYEKQNMLS